MGMLKSAVNRAAAKAWAESTNALLFPVKRVKALLELQGVNRKYLGIIDCFASVFRAGGLAALWYGNGALMACSLPSLLFKESDARMAITKWFKPETPGARIVVGLVAAHSARLCSAAVNFPFQTLYMRRVSAPPSSAPTSLREDVERALSSREACLSLYSGVFASTWIPVLHNFVWFTTMSAFRERRPWAQDSGVWGKVSKLLTPQLALATIGFVIYPFESAVRRLRVDSQYPKEQRRFNGFFHCLRTVAAEEGVARLWAGFGATILDQACQFWAGFGASILDRACQAVPLVYAGVKAKPNRPPPTSDKIAKYFDHLDTDHDGFLSQDELRGITKRTTTSPTGRGFTTEEAAEALGVLDKDGDGRVSLAEFQQSVGKK